MNHEYAIIQNLRDAGCDADLIEDFVRSYRERKTSEQMRILFGQRNLLLHHIHDGQKKLDCLDYLIYNIKKELSQNDL